MYKITVLFESNIEGIYSKEEETADNETFLYLKFKRMAERWIRNISPYLDSDYTGVIPNIQLSLLPIHLCDELNESFMPSDCSILKIKLYHLSKHIDLLNACDDHTIPNTRKRKFSITISKI